MHSSVSTQKIKAFCLLNDSELEFFLAFSGDQGLTTSLAAPFNRNTTDMPGGLSGAGPIVIFDASEQKRSVIISQYQNFFAGS